MSIPEDMKFFRSETTGKVVVLGRKTLDTFPGGQPLKNRTNIILTRNPNYQVKGAIICHSVEEVLEELKAQKKHDNVINLLEHFAAKTAEAKPVISDPVIVRPVDLHQYDALRIGKEVN